MTRTSRRQDEALFAELRMLAGSVPVGSTNGGIVCPSCGGGSSRETSLSITRVDASLVLYKCHRASCDCHGAIGRAFSGNSESVCSKSVSPVRVFTGEVQRLGPAWEAELAERYSITSEVTSQFGYREEVGSGRLVVPIRDPLGRERGIHTRVATGSRGAKTLDYKESSPWLGWFVGRLRGYISGGAETQVVLVEDAISATKVAMAGFTGVSLMGSSLSVESLEEILGITTAPILALDRDATGSALRIRARYGLVASDLRVLILDNDLKYVDITRIREMVNGVTSTV